MKVLGEEWQVFSHPLQRASNVVARDGCVAVQIEGDFRTVWRGDIDVTLWIERLAALARLLGLQVAVFNRHGCAGRGGLARGERAIVFVDPNGAFWVGPAHRRSVCVAPDGVLRAHADRGAAS